MDNEKLIVQKAAQVVDQMTSRLNVPESAGEDPVEVCEEMLAQKCQEVETACRSFAERIKRDWEATDGNPYIKKTDICRIEIYRNADDPAPIDTFERKKEQGYTLRALLLTGATTLLASYTAKYLVRSIIKKL